MDNRINALKLFACLLVVFLHASLDSVLSLGPQWWAANLFDSFSRVCVPLFLMISGVTLLDRKEPILDFLKKRVSRVVLPLVFWSLIYLCWLNGYQAFRFDWLVTILKGPVIYHLWYLYAILGIYAITPILRVFYRNSTSSERNWMLAIWFFSGSVFPLFKIMMNFSACTPFAPGQLEAVYNISSFSGLFGFFLLGAVLKDRHCNRFGMLSVYIFTSMITAIATSAQSSMANKVCVTMYNYQAPMVVISAAAIFCVFLTYKQKKPSNLLRILADSTLGVYCLHILVLANMHKWLRMLPAHQSAWIDIPEMAIATFILCLAIITTCRLFRPVRWVT